MTFIGVSARPNEWKASPDASVLRVGRVRQPGAGMESEVDTKGATVRGGLGL